MTSGHGRAQAPLCHVIEVAHAVILSHGHPPQESELCGRSEQTAREHRTAGEFRGLPWLEGNKEAMADHERCMR